jgi:hypothetical protein
MIDLFIDFTYFLKESNVNGLLFESSFGFGMFGAFGLTGDLSGLRFFKLNPRKALF